MTRDGWQTVHDYAADLRIAAIAVWRHEALPSGPAFNRADWEALAPVEWAAIGAPGAPGDPGTPDGQAAP